MPESSNTGGRKPRVSDRDLLDVFRSTADPVLSTAEVADAVPIKRRGVLNRLRDLEDAGELASKQIGGRNTVWWILDRGDADTFDAEDLRGDPTTTLADESGESDARADADADATDGPADPPADAHGGHAAGEEDALDAVDRVADSWEGTDDQLEARKAAARAVLDYAREHGTVSKQEAKKNIRPEYPVEGQNARTWYRKTIRPVLNEAAEYDQSARAYRLTDAEGDT